MATITSITPNTGSGDGGTFVTITGTGFTGTYNVAFDNNPFFDFTVVNDTTITGITPFGAFSASDGRLGQRDLLVQHYSDIPGQPPVIDNAVLASGWTYYNAGEGQELFNVIDLTLVSQPTYNSAVFDLEGRQFSSDLRRTAGPVGGPVGDSSLVMKLVDSEVILAQADPGKSEIIGGRVVLSGLHNGLATVTDLVPGTHYFFAHQDDGHFHDVVNSNTVVVTVALPVNPYSGVEPTLTGGLRSAGSRFKKAKS